LSNNPGFERGRLFGRTQQMRSEVWAEAAQEGIDPTSRAFMTTFSLAARAAERIVGFIVPNISDADRELLSLAVLATGIDAGTCDFSDRWSGGFPYRSPVRSWVGIWCAEMVPDAFLWVIAAAGVTAGVWDLATARRWWSAPLAEEPPASLRWFRWWPHFRRTRLTGNLTIIAFFLGGGVPWRRATSTGAVYRRPRSSPCWRQ
jgi:hypothetical protein